MKSNTNGSNFIRTLRETLAIIYLTIKIMVIINPEGTTRVIEVASRLW